MGAIVQQRRLILVNLETAFKDAEAKKSQTSNVFQSKVQDQVQVQENYLKKFEKVQDLNTQITNLSSLIIKLNKDLSDYTNNVMTTSSIISQINKAIDLKESQISSKNTAVSNINNRLSSGIDQGKNQNNALIANNTAQINTKQQRSSNNRDIITGNSGVIKANNDTISANTQTITFNNSLISNIDTRDSLKENYDVAISKQQQGRSLTQAETGIINTYNELNEKIGTKTKSELEQENNRLEQENIILEQEKETLKQSLIQENNNLDAEIASLMNNNATLVSKNQTLDAERLALPAEKTRLEAEISVLNSELPSLKTQKAQEEVKLGETSLKLAKAKDEYQNSNSVIVNLSNQLTQSEEEMRTVYETLTGKEITVDEFKKHLSEVIDIYENKKTEYSSAKQDYTSIESIDEFTKDPTNAKDSLDKIDPENKQTVLSSIKNILTTAINFIIGSPKPQDNPSDVQELKGFSSELNSSGTNLDFNRIQTEVTKIKEILSNRKENLQFSLPA